MAPGDLAVVRCPFCSTFTWNCIVKQPSHYAEGITMHHFFILELRILHEVEVVALQVFFLGFKSQQCPCYAQAE